jgi:hypothetical protein
MLAEAFATAVYREAKRERGGPDFFDFLTAFSLQLGERRPIVSVLKALPVAKQ